MRSRAPCTTLAAAAVAVVLAGPGCAGSPAEPGAPGRRGVVKEVVPASAVVGSFDTTRTYEYRFVRANADSLFAALLDANMAVTQAWEPLDNRCLDPRGPVFTVELARPDPRVATFDFVPGTGRLTCATQLRRYRVG